MERGGFREAWEQASGGQVAPSTSQRLNAHQSESTCLDLGGNNCGTRRRAAPSAASAPAQPSRRAVAAQVSGGRRERRQYRRALLPHWLHNSDERCSFHLEKLQSKARTRVNQASSKQHSHPKRAQLWRVPHQVGGRGETVDVDGHPCKQLAALQASGLSLELFLQGDKVDSRGKESPVRRIAGEQAYPP